MRKQTLCILLLLLSAAGCTRRASAARETPERRLNATGFHQLLGEVAQGWQQGDVPRALAAFDCGAVYLQPPDQQLYVGHAQLRPYFAAVAQGTRMQWHTVAFDSATQRGLAEFTFDAPGPGARASHGVAVITLRGGRIAQWREYVTTGPAEFDAFIDTAGKAWQWTIRNYPSQALQDSVGR